MFSDRCRLPLLGLLLTAPGAVSAQAPDSLPGAAPFAEIVTLGSPAEDRLRVRHLLEGAPTDGFLIRSPATLTPALVAPPDGWTWSLVAPRVRATWNSALPFSANDGALWAGRGLGAALLAGVRASHGPFSLVLAPELVHQENRAYQFIAYPGNRLPVRHPLAGPWYPPPASLDLPARFGAEADTRVLPGQSSLSMDAGALALGVATENLWWGPGVRNALVMSDNAAGIPHGFLRTRRPLATPLGEVEGRWIFGTLAESEYFDFDSRNDRRSLSALVVTLRPGASGPTLGFTRAVYALRPGGAVSPASALDVFRSVRPDADDPDASGDPLRDQLFSWFGRWVFPDAGFEAYFEWGRYEQPASLRDLLAEPDRSQGYTLGLQWARPVTATGAARVQAELSYLEPSSPETEQILSSWYTSSAVPQGYTQQGQIIGASIGPAASSQWLAADFLAPAWQVGWFAGRIRWDTAAFYRLGLDGLTVPPNILQYDVSLFTGVRAAVRARGLEATAEYSVGTRFNYLYQNLSPELGNRDFAVDIRNHSLRIGLAAAPGSR